MPERSQHQDDVGVTSAEHRNVEAVLRSVAPRAAGRVDLVAAAYAAGRRSAAGQLRVWRAASAAAVIIGVGGWVVRTGGGVAPPTMGRIAPQALVTAWRSDEPAPPRRAAPAQSVLMLQEAVGEHGVDGLPPSDIPAATGTRPGDVF